MTDTRPTITPSRRSVLKGAAALAGAAGITSAGAAGSLRAFDAEAATAPAYQGIFGYGVASGDPTADAVVIWTRATPPARPGEPVAAPGSGLGRPLEVQWELALDEDFRQVVRRGHVTTSPASDHTVKVDVTGLAAYTRYWYRFSAQGQTSPVGRTQTAPDEPHRVHALRFALVSCSNYTGGYFTTYRALGQRDDLDFILHVGDYIYEYTNGEDQPDAADDRYGPKALVGVRDAQPAGEANTLTGYRLRHAIHKADPDLALAHQQHPFIAIFDDHEVANNAWATGAENHTPSLEGDFAVRRRAAYQAYMEWMPFRLPDQHDVPHQGTRFFKRFTFGPLGDLLVLETRQNRSAQIDVAPFTKTGGGFIPTGAVPAVDAAVADPSRHLPEPEQLDWLKGHVSARGPWHLLGNQVMISPIRYPGALLGAGDYTLLNSDQWDGYQADQADLLAHLGARPASAGDVVVLTGDIHSSWAVELPATLPAPGEVPFAGVTAYDSVGVEFVCPSVTSDGFYEIVGEAAGWPAVAADTLVATTHGAEAALRGYNAWVKYLDGIGHGYVLVDVTPERVQADFFVTPIPTTALVDPRTSPTVLPSYKASMQTLAGSRSLSVPDAPIGERSDEPRQVRTGPRQQRSYPREVRNPEQHRSRSVPNGPFGPIRLQGGRF